MLANVGEVVSGSQIPIAALASCLEREAEQVVQRSLILVALMFALAVSGCSGNRAGADNAETAENGQTPSGAAATQDQGRTEAQQYVAQFAKGHDAGTCFDKNVTLDSPKLESRPDGQLGLRTLPTRVVVMVDGSGSMAGRIGGRTKIDLAREAIRAFVDDLPSTVSAALLSFGQQGSNGASGKGRSCEGIDLLAPLSNDRDQLRGALARIRAVGWTPLAAGLARAEAMLDASAPQGTQIIYVVSDGVETCGGDPVAVAKRINGGNARAIVNVIGFGLPSKDAAALRAVTDAGGGDFVNVATEAQFDTTMARLREANRKAGNALRTSNAIAGNALRTSNATSSAALCISDMISGESLEMSNDLSARALRGDAVPYQKQALALLKERHDRLQAQAAAYEARVKGAEDASRWDIERAKAGVR